MSISSDFVTWGVFSWKFSVWPLMLFLCTADGNNHRNQYSNQRDQWYDAALSGSLDVPTVKTVTTSDSKRWICLAIRKDQERGWPAALSEITDLKKKSPEVYFQKEDFIVKIQTLRYMKSIVLVASLRSSCGPGLIQDDCWEGRHTLGSKLTS